MTVMPEHNGLKVSRRRIVLGGAVGTLLVLNGGILATRYLSRRRIPNERELPQPIDLSFVGPFAYDQQVLKSAVTNSWVELNYLQIDDKTSNGLHACFEFKGEKDPRRQVRFLLTATSRNGKTYTLADATHTDPRLLEPTLVGSLVRHPSIVCGEAMQLPIAPTEIAKLDVQIAQIR